MSLLLLNPRFPILDSPLNPLTPKWASKAMASKVGFSHTSPVVTLGFSVVVVVGIVPVPGSGASVLVVVIRGLGSGFGPPAPACCNGWFVSGTRRW